MKLDIKNPKHAYFIGFAQSDGTLHDESRSRGKFSMELQKSDEPLLRKMAEIFDCNTSIGYRSRDTNFKNGYESVVFRLYDHDTREEIRKYVPAGKKSSIIFPPNGIVPREYYRGIIDGDGSLGMTGAGFPFISLVTASEPLARGFEAYIKELTGLEKHTNPNKRDGVYNIMVNKENAQTIIRELYYDGCMCLPRKKAEAEKALTWVRPADMRIRSDKIVWTPIQDEFLVTHSPEECREMFHHLPSGRIWYRRTKLLKELSKIA